MDVNANSVGETHRGSVPYMVLADTFSKIEKEKGRVKSVYILRDMFSLVLAESRHAPEKTLSAVVYLCANKIRPEYEGESEMNVGESIIMQALAESTGRTLASLKAEMVAVGDLGVLAHRSRKSQKTLLGSFSKKRILTVEYVLESFRRLAHTKGKKSREEKKRIVKDMLVACRENESMYIVRSLAKTMRIGIQTKSILCALASLICSKLPSEKDKEVEKAINQAVKQAYSQHPNYEGLVHAIFQALEKACTEPRADAESSADICIRVIREACRLSVDIPVQPMLAYPVCSIEQVYEKFGSTNPGFTAEYKYDGERIQVHYCSVSSGPVASISMFSRNGENVTGKYPDLVKIIERVSKRGNLQSFILDCECVAFSHEAETILPFQKLATRSRKDVSLANIGVPVILFVFDCLFIDGKALLDEPLYKRREMVRSSFEFGPEFRLPSYTDIDTDTGIDIGINYEQNGENGNIQTDLHDFFNKALDDKCEGLMLKSLSSSYRISERSFNWLKLKKDYVNAESDTLDLVPIGAYYGKGKRTGVYGAYLLACYNSETEEYESICKVSTGFDESSLHAFKTDLAEFVIDAPCTYYAYDQSVCPDIWFMPAYVWEIKCADLSISPVHKAACGEVHESRGIGLRFPRFIRKRADKAPEDASASSQVAYMYNLQTNK
jgi:DNA ligase-1